MSLKILLSKSTACGTPIRFYRLFGFKERQYFQCSKLEVILLLGFHVFIGLNATAQAADRPFKLAGLYAGIGYERYSLSSFFANNWGVSVSAKHINLTAQNLPDDYEPGVKLASIGSVLIGPYNVPIGAYTSLPIPTDNLVFSSLMLMREFNIRFPRIRFGLEAGPSRTSYTVAHFTKKINYASKESNYSVTYTSLRTTGLLMRAKVEFPVGRFVGFEFALVVNINKYKPYIGFDAFFNFGFVREKIQSDMHDESVASPR